MALTRRDFIGVAAATAVLGGTGGLTFLMGNNQLMLRPPGGQNENRLNGLCVKCDRCRSVCPLECISVAHVEDGLLQARTPKLDFHRGYCDFCNRCIEVCPTQALQPFDPSVQKIGVAEVRPERCIAWTNPGSCVKCEEVCRFDAIHFVDGLPVVDAEACNGCGECEFHCPALVYTSLSSGETRGITVVPAPYAERVSQDERSAFDRTATQEKEQG